MDWLSITRKHFTRAPVVLDGSMYEYPNLQCARVGGGLYVGLGHGSVWDVECTSDIPPRSWTATCRETGITHSTRTLHAMAMWLACVEPENNLSSDTHP